MTAPSCLEVGFCGQKRARRTFSDHVISLHHLSSLPSRIFTNGKSRGSCIFTQQGRKGINQDAMVVWEVSMFMLLVIIQSMNPLNDSRETWLIFAIDVLISICIFVGFHV